MLTLADIRRLVAPRLGGYRSYTSGIQAVPPDGGYVGTPNGADARRHVITTDAVSMDSTGEDTDLPQDAEDSSYIYIPDRMEQRQVAVSGFLPNELASAVSDQSGSTERVSLWTLTRPLGTALEPGVEIEVHHTLGPLPDRYGMGIHDCINEALSKMVFAMRVVVAGNGTTKTDLSALDWLTSAAQLIQVYGSVDDIDAANPDVLPGGGVIEFDGPIPYLLTNTPVSTGTDYFIRVYRPIGSYIYSGGSWQDSTVGLEAEDDAVAVDRRIIQQCALYYCYDTLATSTRSLPVQAAWEKRRDRVATFAAKWLMLDQTLNPPRPTHGTRGTQGTVMTAVGPVSGRRGVSWP